MRVLVVGDILLDTIASVDAEAVDLNCRIDTRECEICFDYGSKIPVETQQQFPGGNAANVAVGLTHLGVACSLVSAVGDDDVGRRLLSELAQSGVDIKQVTTDRDIPTSSSFIVRYMGERTIFSYHAPHAITVSAGGADVVYLTSARSDLEQIYHQIDTLLPEAIRVFQPGTSQLRLGVARLAPILQSSNLLIVNETEAAVLLNTLPGRQSPKQLLHALLDTKVKEVIVTAGQRGVYLSDGRDFVHLETWQSAVRRDTTGVGDAFAAAYVWSRYGQKSDLRSAATAGTINAGSVLSKTGAQEGLMDAAELQKTVSGVQLNSQNL